MISIVELAADLDLDDGTLRRWAKAGCPHEGGGDQPYLFDRAAVLAWMDETGRTGQRGRPAAGTAPDDQGGGLGPTRKIREATAAVNLRLKRLDAQRKERIERTAMGLLIPVDEVERGRLQRIAAVKAGLLSLPGKLAPRIANRDATEIQAEIEREVYSLLREFAGEPEPAALPNEGSAA